MEINMRQTNKNMIQKEGLKLKEELQKKPVKIIESSINLNNLTDVDLYKIIMTYLIFECEYTSTQEYWDNFWKSEVEYPTPFIAFIRAYQNGEINLNDDVLLEVI